MVNPISTNQLVGLSTVCTVPVFLWITIALGQGCIAPSPNAGDHHGYIHIGASSSRKPEGRLGPERSGIADTMWAQLCLWGYKPDEYCVVVEQPP